MTDSSQGTPPSASRSTGRKPRTPGRVVLSILKWIVIVGVALAVIGAGVFGVLYARQGIPNPNTDFQTNLTSVYRASKAVLRGMMKARKGRIVNIASVIGVTGNAGQANYAAAKAGTIAMSKSIAREIGSRGVTVNCVAPGFIATDMTDALNDAQKQALLAQIPLGRLGSADDVAEAVVFLASSAAAYITGQVIEVNGGMRM